MARAEWDGAYYDGQTARRIAVKVYIAKTGLRLQQANGRQHQWPYTALKLTQGSQPGEHVRLEHGLGDTPEALEIVDRAFLAAVAELAPEAKLGGSLLLGKRFGMAVGSSVLGIFGAIAAMYLWGIPALADHAAQHVPLEWEDQLGSYVLESIAPEPKRCHDKAKQAAVERIVAALTKPIKSPYTYKVTVVANNDVNAFAAPGGYIVVFTGLLEKTKRPEELAGILAHEIQHVEKRHSTRGLLRQLSMQVLLSALTGDTGQLGQVLGAAGSLGNLAYQRGDEEEADREGMALMLGAHIDPKGMIAAFRTLEAESGGGGDNPNLNFLSTHPATGDRIAKLTAQAKEAKGTFPALLPGVKWPKIAAGCR